jgi:hypothetical protein
MTASDPQHAPSMPRDFVGYGDQPPRFEWPRGARLALNLVVNYDIGGLLRAERGSPYHSSCPVL